MGTRNRTTVELIQHFLAKFLALTVPPPALVPIRIQNRQRFAGQKHSHLHETHNPSIWPTPKPRSRIRQAPRPKTK